MKFGDLKIGDFFRLSPDPTSRSWNKTSPLGYWVDRVFGELVVNPEMEVWPIDPVFTAETDAIETVDTPVVETPKKSVGRPKKGVTDDTPHVDKIKAKLKSKKTS